MPLRSRAARALTGLSCQLLLGLLASSCERSQPSAAAPQPSAATQPSAAIEPPPVTPVADPQPSTAPPAAAAAPSGETAQEPHARLRLGPDEPEERLAAERFAGSAFFVPQILSELAVARLRELKPVGSTSTVFRATLDAPFRAAFKAATRARPRGPTAEVAAYRMARLLGLSNVPPAILRKVPRDTLQRELEPRFAGAWPKIAEQLRVDTRGEVEGAAIFWIDGMQDLAIGERPVRELALRALRQSEEIPEGLRALLPQLSNLLVFDWLIGNTDRWSGANVKGDATGQLLYIRDQDFAFARLSTAQQERLLAPLTHSERFSRSLIQRVRNLTRERFERELAQDPIFLRQPPRIEEPVMAAVFERRDKLLAHVDGLVAKHGQDAVLLFP